MSKKYDVVASTGTYTGNDGQEKRRYQNVGAVFEKDGKFYLKLTSLVTCDNDGNVINFFSLFEPKKKEQKPAPAQQAPQTGDFDDDIPF